MDDKLKLLIEQHGGYSVLNFHQTKNYSTISHFPLEQRTRGGLRILYKLVKKVNRYGYGKKSAMFSWIKESSPQIHSTYPQGFPNTVQVPLPLPYRRKSECLRSYREYIVLPAHVLVYQLLKRKYVQIYGTQK